MVDEQVLAYGLRDILKGKYNLSQIYSRIKNAIESYKSKWTYKPDKITIDPEELKKTIQYENEIVKRLLALTWPE